MIHRPPRSLDVLSISALDLFASALGVFVLVAIILFPFYLKRPSLEADLAGAQVELIDEIGRELRLRMALDQVKAEYDYILIDCPPSLNLLTVNALVAADSVMIPMQCEYFALEGLSALVETIRKVRETLNPKLRIEGLLRTMFDGRNTLSNEVSEQLQKHFGSKVYNTIIPRNVRLAEAPSFGMPVLYHDKSSRGALAYLALAGEILRREDDRRMLEQQASGAMG